VKQQPAFRQRNRHSAGADLGSRHTSLSAAALRTSPALVTPSRAAGSGCGAEQFSARAFSRNLRKPACVYRHFGVASRLGGGACRSCSPGRRARVALQRPGQGPYVTDDSGAGETAGPEERSRWHGTCCAFSTAASPQLSLRSSLRPTCPWLSLARGVASAAAGGSRPPGTRPGSQAWTVRGCPSSPFRAPGLSDILVSAVLRPSAVELAAFSCGDPAAGAGAIVIGARK
jgi:hypothetical protein